MSKISPLFAVEAEQLFVLESYDEVIALCEKGLEVYPDYQGAHMLLAKAYAITGQAELAKGKLESFQQQFPGHRYFDSFTQEIDEIIAITPEAEENTELVDSDEDAEVEVIFSEYSEEENEEIAEIPTYLDDFEEEIDLNELESEIEEEDTIDLSVSEDNADSESDYLDDFNMDLASEIELKEEDDDNLSLEPDTFEASEDELIEDISEESSSDSDSDYLSDFDLDLPSEETLIDEEPSEDLEVELPEPEPEIEDLLEENIEEEEALLEESPVEETISEEVIAEERSEELSETQELNEDDILNELMGGIADLIGEDLETLKEEIEEKEPIQELEETEIVAPEPDLLSEEKPKEQKESDLKMSLILGYKFDRKLFGNSELDASNLSLIPGLSFVRLLSQKKEDSKFSYVHSEDNFPEFPDYGYSEDFPYDLLGASLVENTGSHSNNIEDIAKMLKDFDKKPVENHLEEDYDDNIISETMAQIYTAQGEYDQAKDIYKTLAELYPDKREYFLDKSNNL